MGDPTRSGMKCWWNSSLIAYANAIAAAQPGARQRSARSHSTHSRAKVPAWIILRPIRSAMPSPDFSPGWSLRK